MFPIHDVFRTAICKVRLLPHAFNEQDLVTARSCFANAKSFNLEGALLYSEAGAEPCILLISIKSKETGGRVVHLSLFANIILSLVVRESFELPEYIQYIYIYSKSD